MHPILFSLGPFTIYSYGVLLAAAYLIGLGMAVRRARDAGLDGNRVLDLGIWVIIAALVGAKALLFIVDFRQFTSSWQDFTTLLRSGGVFYGGLIAAVVVCIYQLRKHRLPLWTSADLFAPGIALGYMVGRLGCLMAGCCYGRATDVAWAITFTDPAANLNVGTPAQRAAASRRRSTSRSPAWSSSPALVLLERRGRGFPGRTFWMFVLLYSVSRFIIEFYRGDDRGFVFNAVSTSQAISLVLAPLACSCSGISGGPSSRPRPRRRAGRASRGSRERFSGIRGPWVELCRWSSPVRYGIHRGRGERLDRYLAGEIPNYSRSQIQRLIDEGHVVVTARQAHQGQRPAARRRRGRGDAARAGGRDARAAGHPRSTSCSTIPTSSSSTSRRAWWSTPRPAIRTARW